MFSTKSYSETVCLLSKIRSARHIDIDPDMTELVVTSAETKATYDEIKSYVFEHTGLIDCTAYERAYAENMYQRSELDYLIYNDPIGYAELVMEENPQAYLFCSVPKYCVIS